MGFYALKTIITEIIMTRRESRICVFELLYEADFHKDIDPLEVYDRSLSSREAKGSEFAKSLFTLCALNIAEIDKIISESAENWKLSRMTAVTKAILRMAVGEMLYTEVPPKACINEAVEISKVYDEGKAPRFINGVLNKIARACGKIADGE
ncbi:MAG: transcription antitermination factor NusB [Ruminococcaceae bacterium]|nr:transcription antitermination factor NusB [Oscillospiraceae bacterium]